jgi:predicted CoA-binding protein
MQQVIRDFVQCKQIAVVGVSRSGKKFGNSIATELRQRGYQVFVVHPEAEEIDGFSCYPDLAALAGKVDAVVICVPPQKAVQVLRDAVAAGMKNIWLQQGADSSEAQKVARELGVTPVSGKCILMYAGQVNSVHAFHRFIWKLVGQY